MHFECCIKMAKVVKYRFFYLIDGLLIRIIERIIDYLNNC